MTKRAAARNLSGSGSDDMETGEGALGWGRRLLSRGDGGKERSKMIPRGGPMLCGY